VIAPLSPSTPTLPQRTRLAPSPTGALHLGNARTFLVTWALARRLGWSIVLRIEDLDGPRVKPGVIDLTIDLLAWLGMDWDEGPIIQSHDLSPSLAAMDHLCRGGLAYASTRSLSEIERAAPDPAASAPQEGSGEVRFPAELRPSITPGPFVPPPAGDAAPAYRFATPPEIIRFDDGFAGPVTVDVARDIGDFIIWTRRGTPAYQLAVVVDDHRQRVTQVIRGDDLIPSAGRQRLLAQALGYTPLPAYTHLPLVRGSDGRRLAKRHGDTRLDAYRARKVTPERVIGLLASWCGIPGPRRPMSAREFLERLDLRTMSTSAITFTQEDDAWLLSRTPQVPRAGQGSSP
jgi:glutamyl-tRNA synthetase